MKKSCFIFLLVLVSCGAPKVSYDYDKSINFNQFKTYNYYPDMDTGMNQLDDKRLIRQIDSILATKGFTQTDTPELLINIKTARFESGSPFTVGLGVGSVGRRGGVGVSGGVPVGGASLNEEILFDMIDTKRNELIWQGRSEKRVSDATTPLAREKYFSEVVGKVFEKFPPQKK
ncbi:DUF4136 domain-containing protein [Flavobacteriaceae bacterium M23B6Z8]